MNLLMVKGAPSTFAAITNHAIKLMAKDEGGDGPDLRSLVRPILVWLRDEVRGDITAPRVEHRRITVARHEAAHVLVAMANRLPPVYAFVAKNNGAAICDKETVASRCSDLLGGMMAMAVAGMVSDDDGRLDEGDALVFGVAYMASCDGKVCPGGARRSFGKARTEAASALKRHRAAHHRLSNALYSCGELGAVAIRRIAGPELTRGLFSSATAAFDTMASAAYFSIVADAQKTATGVTFPKPHRCHENTKTL